MSDQPFCIREILENQPPGTCLWVTASAQRLVAETMRAPTGPRIIPNLQSITPSDRNLVVIGGGEMIDVAKAFRAENRPDMQLTAIPTIWGSGAEVSPIAVLNIAGKKLIKIGKELVPDKFLHCPELFKSIPDNLALWASGDAFSHALEAFLSPLATQELQEQASQSVQAMLKLGLKKDPAWAELSRKACKEQAQASVGLIHGFAHTLETPLRTQNPTKSWGHAKICSLFLYPVFRFNLKNSSKLETLTAKFQIDLNEVESFSKSLFNIEEYEECIPLIEKHWNFILRDMCTRTNSALVRASHLSFFTEIKFT